MTSIARAIARRWPSSKTEKLSEYCNKHPVITNCDPKFKSYHDIPMKQDFWPSGLGLILDGGPGYLHEHCDKRHRELGPIYREKLGSAELVFLADTKLIQAVLAKEGRWPHHNIPEAWLYYNQVKNIQRGLFFQSGVSWARMRKVLNKVMLSDMNRITLFSDDLLRINLDLMRSWQEKLMPIYSNDFTIDDIKAELNKWSIESTGFMLFGCRMGCVPSESRPDYDQKAEQLVNNVVTMFAETSNFQVVPVKLAHKLNLGTWKRFEEASSNMIRIASNYADEYIDKTHSNSTHGLLHDILAQGELSDDEISRSLVDLLIAAADTTSNSLQWMLYLLAKHQDVQAKILKETSFLLEKPSCLIQNATYLRAFVREASRLYPTAPFLARTLDQDITLGGYSVPAGKPIVFSLFTTSRSKNYFDKPLEFKPERWLRSSNGCPQEKLAKNHAYASLPFGIGARNCIGRRAAEVQMHLFIASYVRKFESSLVKNSDLQIKLKMVLCPKVPISIKLRPRS